MRAVRRPNEIVDVLGCVGEALSFTAGAVEEPDLRLAFVAGGKEGEVLAVGAPPRVRGGDALGGHRDSVAASSGDSPDAVLGLIFL